MPSGGVHSITEIRALLRRLLRAIRANWPATEILLRADSHYCGPEVIDWCRANRIDFIFGVAPTSTLRRHVERLEASTLARFVAAPQAGKVRRYREFYDGAARQLEPGRAHHRSRRGRGRRNRHPLHRHEPADPKRSCAL